MPSYGEGNLKVKTLGDLRELVKKLADLEDDYELKLDSYEFLDYTLTDDIDVSYSSKIVSITLDVK